MDFSISCQRRRLVSCLSVHRDESCTPGHMLYRLSCPTKTTSFSPIFFHTRPLPSSPSSGVLDHSRFCYKPRGIVKWTRKKSPIYFYGTELIVLSSSSGKKERFFLSGPVVDYNAAWCPLLERRKQLNPFESSMSLTFIPRAKSFLEFLPLLGKHRLLQCRSWRTKTCRSAWRGKPMRRWRVCMIGHTVSMKICNVVSQLHMVITPTRMPRIYLAIQFQLKLYLILIYFETVGTRCKIYLLKQ